MVLYSLYFFLTNRISEHTKIEHKLNLSKIFYEYRWQVILFWQDFQLEKRLDNQVIQQCSGILDGTQKHIDINMKITNEDRAFASTLSYHIATWVFTDMYTYFRIYIMQSASYKFSIILHTFIVFDFKFHSRLTESLTNFLMLMYSTNILWFVMRQPKVIYCDGELSFKEAST